MKLPEVLQKLLAETEKRHKPMVGEAWPYDGRLYCPVCHGRESTYAVWPCQTLKSLRLAVLGRAKYKELRKKEIAELRRDAARDRRKNKRIFGE